MKLLITGATGYIGARVVQHAINRGHEIVVASRSRPVASNLTWMPYELASGSTIKFPPGIQGIIHLAADTAFHSGIEGECEVQSARLLIEAAQRSTAKFVFISSQTARPEAPTAYGRTKWRVEQEVLASGGTVVRPGLVYGGCERGLFGLLVAAARQFPVIPAFFPAPKVQHIHVDDLAEALLRIVEHDDNFSGVLHLASPESVSFTRFMSIVADARLHRHRLFVPIPIMLSKIAGVLMGKQLRVRLGFERLNSLFDLPFMDTADDLRKLELSLRPLASGMHPSGNNKRRRLIHEGRVMLCYVLKTNPNISQICRYVRAVECLQSGTPLELPTWILRFPITLALFDVPSFPLSLRGVEFVWRLDAATMLAEATPQGAYQFLGLGRVAGPVTSLITIFRAVIAEVIWRMLSLIATPILQRYMRGAGS